MLTSTYQIRSMTEKEVQLAVDWAALEGWNPGLNDARLFYGADRQGFLAGFLDGSPVATVSAVKYGTNFGFIGFYIVKPDFRGKGFGLRLWQAAMTRLEGCNIGLDGVVAQQDNYRKSGFKLAYNNIRYQGQVPETPVGNPNLTNLSDVDFDTLSAYDSAHFFAPRPGFLGSWIKQQSSLALGCTSNGRLQGYGVIRQCVTGCKVGPLFADNPDIATQLFAALANYAKGRTIFLDVPEPNAAAISLAAKNRMLPVFHTARMYTAEVPSVDLTKIFGVTSFELG